MLVTKTAFFHIQFIPFRWYDDDKNAKKVTQEPFIVADKFIQENIIYNYDEFMILIQIFVYLIKTIMDFVKRN